MESPDCGFDDFLDDECGVFVSGLTDGHFDVRITDTAGGEFFCVFQRKNYLIL
ncbi:hypothetical protein F9U38_07560 [Pectobacterium versatile]|uniref:hypothetical protein n=1 Tax=Pectobacterium versatile TaxID=2488639 RepID=UPI001B3A4FB1|nr:hypothetical protein [Pectobacterium versatile]MBQ4780360.1 hypothetical protein [Pectobacterium versatile]MBQ4784755.1 hypothetical protein [Pectobacterium versatile]